MKVVLRFLAAGIVVVPVFAADPAGFALWRATELKQRDEALSKKVGPDHSARETLADYGDHRFRLPGEKHGQQTMKSSDVIHHFPAQVESLPKQRFGGLGRLKG